LERQLLFELPNDLHCIEETVEFVVARCSTCEQVARKLRFNFRVCLAEALSNAMIYGNGQDPSKRVRVEISMHVGRLTASVTDEGTGFDPDRVPDPTIPQHIKRTNGRGLFIMRKLMDEVRFNDRGNSVTLVLHLPDSSQVSHEASA